ncbi:hypothetical protein DPV73_11815 [Leptospira mayottensis]|nr:hypothetical protein DPV73_11815 [Leptospira mayottensis]
MENTPNKQEKALKILSKRKKTFDYKIVNLIYEKFWKDKSFYEANFRIYLNSKNTKSVVF